VSTKPLSGWRFVAASAAFLLLHLAFSFAAESFEVEPGISLWYPPVGFALAFVILAGARAVPVVLASALVAVFLPSTAPVTVATVTLALLIAAIYSLCGMLVHRRFGPLPHPSTPRQATIVVGLVLAGPVLASMLGVALSTAAGLLDGSVSYLPPIFSWWVGDLLGVLTVAPLCLVHAGPLLLRNRASRRRRWPRAERLEAVAQTALLVGCVLAVRGLGYVHARESFYLCFIPLVWICLRHGMRGATAAVFALTIGSLLVAREGALSHPALLDLLLFELAVSVIGLGLGATVSRRAAVEKERSRLLAILEVTPDFVGTADLSGRVLYQNRSLLRLRGHTVPEQSRDRQVWDFLPDWAAHKLRTEGIPAALREGLWEGETAVRDASGGEVPIAHRLITHFDDEGRPVMLSSVGRDLSADKAAERARRESERNLLEAQKLESLGVLAGGIAHDFNNLLTVMLGNATLARLDVPPDSPAERAIHQIELAALRAADLCRQMLAYSGKGRLTTEPVDLTRLVDETTHLLKVSISKKCSLEFDLDRALPPVQGDATQLSQITMNLVMNASDACGERGGAIVVRTGVMQAGAAYLATTYLAPDLSPGRYVFLEVSDDGCGMAPEVLARIFEPFFTTKFSGHGLGLSAVLGIARSHQGAIKVESTPGTGTTFRLLLPAAGGAAGAPASPAAAAVAWRGAGCVLVVDDEEPVREIATRILERIGFTTRSAVHGRQAVELFAAHPRQFRAILLDLTMPVMNGPEAFRELRRLDPSIPVILMSGYNRTDSTAELLERGPAGFVHKPFDAAGLTEAMRTVLQAAPPADAPAR
jgi:PAS domain S-box-containing protein